MANASPLTKSRCLEISRLIENGFETYGVTIHPQSDVGGFVREILWLADHLDGTDCPPGSESHERAVNALLDLDQAANIASTFSMLARTQIPKMKVQILK